MKREQYIMGKIFLFLTVFFAVATQGVAQKFIDVYKNGKLEKSFYSSYIDSITVTQKNDFTHYIHFWRDGENINSYFVGDLDSIKVFRYEEQPLVYLGIIGFNQELYTQPLDVLSNTTSYIYRNFVNKLKQNDGSLLYCGVDQALDMLANHTFTTPLSSVNLVTFTDGPDQGSLMKDTNHQNDKEYLSYLSQRIDSMRVHGLPVTAYCLGLKGSDVTDSALFQSHLRRLATSDEKAIEVSDCNDLQNRLSEIAYRIQCSKYRQNISIKIPVYNNGTHLFFSLDGRDPETSSLYIKGIFDLDNYSLHDVTYGGICSTSGNMLMGVKEDKSFIFTFKDLQHMDLRYLLPTEYLCYYCDKDSTTWQLDKTYMSGNKEENITSEYGTVVLFVLDCSSSLGRNLSYLQSYIENFISNLANHAADCSVAAPENVTAIIEENERAVNISWDIVKYAEYYCIYRSNNAKSNFKKVADSLTDTNWRDEAPLQGDNYYRVHAIGHGLQMNSTSNVVNCK